MENALELDWEGLTFGSYSREQIDACVDDPDWQRLRLKLRGTALEVKFVKLTDYMRAQNYSFAAKVRVTNYVNALRRGGLVRRRALYISRKPKATTPAPKAIDSDNDRPTPTPSTPKGPLP